MRRAGPRLLENDFPVGFCTGHPKERDIFTQQFTAQMHCFAYLRYVTVRVALPENGSLPYNAKAFARASQCSRIGFSRCVGIHVVVLAAHSSMLALLYLPVSLIFDY